MPREFRRAAMSETSTSIGGGTCRVCNRPILAGDIAQVRGWTSERTHLACGWFEAEYDGVPRFIRGSATCREWKCPECGLDAVGLAPDEDPRCGRCRAPKEGQRAKTRRKLFARNVEIPSGMTCTVIKLSDRSARVAFGGHEVILPRDALVRVAS